MNFSNSSVVLSKRHKDMRGLSLTDYLEENTRKSSSGGSGRESVEQGKSLLGLEELVGGWGCSDEVLVDDAGKAATNKGTDPVNPVVGEVPGSKSRSERSSRVHGTSRESSGEQDVGCDDQADGKGSSDPDVPLRSVVHCGRVDCVHQAERDHDLQHQSGIDCLARRERMR